MKFAHSIKAALKALNQAKYFVQAGALAAFLHSACPAQAIQPDTYIDFSGGYRIDRFTSRFKAEGNPFRDPVDFDRCLRCIDSGSLDDVTLYKTKIKIKDQGIWVAGGRGQIRFCDYWFLRGSGYYGWIDNGKYHETKKNRCLEKTQSRSNVNGGRTRDASIGFGYLYPIFGFWGCQGIGPVVGYAYDDQRYTMGNFITDCYEDCVLRDLVYCSRWSGPWLGVDYAFEHDVFKVMSSLEYHWTTWHGQWRLQRPDIHGVEFSKRFKADNSYGIVWTISGEWNFWQNAHIGLQYTWEFWRTHHGKGSPQHGNFCQVGFPWIDELKLLNTRWYSDTLTLNIGFVW